MYKWSFCAGSDIEAHDELDPSRIIPPHDYSDAQKVARIAESMREHGWVGRPLLVEEHTLFAWTGTNRLKAAVEAGINAPVVYTDSELIADDPEAPGVGDLRDDEERLAELERRGDEDAVAVMWAEIEAQR